MEGENDSVMSIELFKLRIKEKGLAHQSLLEYLGISTSQYQQISTNEGKSEEIYRILKENNILTNKCEFGELLEIISHLWKIHQTKKEFKNKIENLFKILGKDMNIVFSEMEIITFFHISKNNVILLILVEQNIISIGTLIRSINHDEYDDWNIIMYFYPEIRKYDEEFLNKIFLNNCGMGRIKKFIELNDQNLEFFFKVRKENRKIPKIIELIRDDKIEEFISLVEHSHIDLNRKIPKEETIFGVETKKITPIEYSAFFGSIAIFKYLYMKEANINFDTIIKYAIQGRSYEIIHLLEERKEVKEVLNNPTNLLICLITSIKRHYNEIFEYFITNYNIQVTEDIINLLIIYRNYQLLHQLIEKRHIDINDKAIMSIILCGICRNGNEEIVKILINLPNIDINTKDIIFHHLKWLKNM